MIVTPDTTEHGTYDELKEACRRSGGDAAREWMSGATTSGSSVYKAVKKTKDEAVDTIKRGLEEGIGRPDPPGRAPAAPRFPHPSAARSLSTSASDVGDRAKASLNRAADALEGGVAAAKEKVSEAVGGGGDAPQAVNAGAAWEDSRSAD